MHRFAFHFDESKKIHQPSLNFIKYQTKISLNLLILIIYVIIYAIINLLIFKSNNLPKCEYKNFNFLKDVLKCMNLPNNSYFIIDETLRQIEMDRIKTYIRSKYPFKNTTYFCWAGFCGPFTEEYWIKYFYNLSSADFGVFVPLFFEWNRMLYTKKVQEYNEVIKEISNLLNSSFLYFTVSYHDCGVEGRSNGKLLPSNLFVANAGGKGNMPLIMRSKKQTPIKKLNYSNIKYDLVFMGSRTHVIRKILISTFQNMTNLSFFSGRSSKWKEIFYQSKAILCPRGFGRNTFRLTETIELGLIPIYVYNDVCWLPYYNSIKWEEFSLIVQINPKKNINEIDKIVSFVQSLTTSKIQKMHKRIKSLYDTHFSLNASILQLKLFLKYGFHYSDLRCGERMYFK